MGDLMRETADTLLWLARARTKDGDFARAVREVLEELTDAMMSEESHIRKEDKKKWEEAKRRK